MYSRSYLSTALFLLFTYGAMAQQSLTGMPALRNTNGLTELFVDNRPFTITGGELGNSSASSIAYMDSIWPKLVRMHLNTVVAPVYWELLEPREGHFDFTLVDNLIAGARIHHLHLVLLWFGTWKNSMSCYAPGWVKTDQQRFPRTADHNGVTTEIVTPFSANGLAADKNAFRALMHHLRDTDGSRHTVLMIQVENEIGMLPEARDHSRPADSAFQQPVPAALMNYLQQRKTGISAPISPQPLEPEIVQRWQTSNFRTSGTWEEVFGPGPATDELFMAWFFGRYANEVTAAGKAIYPIPMYLNAALNAPGRKPGEYPSAGPLPHVLDIWKAAAPAVNFLSPDFYNPNFVYWNDRYTRPDNPLFIPEHRFDASVDAKAFFANGHYHALGFSPFSIESAPDPANQPIGKVYSIINQLSGEISKAKERHACEGVLLSKEHDTVRLRMGDFNFTIAHDYKLGWSPHAKDSLWPQTGGIILGLSPDEFYIAGTGLVVSFTPVMENPQAGALHAGILRADEGEFVDGKWTPGRRMNGDQDHQGRHIRIPVGDYGIQRVKLYTYR